MNHTQFWQLIESSFDDEVEKHSQNLKLALVKLQAEEILKFSQIFSELDFAACRWDLWAVAAIINGGCSDDCFIDFRSMLIRRGESFYNAMLQNPEEAALRNDVKEEDWEEVFGSCIVEAFEEVAGIPFPELEKTPIHASPPQLDGTRRGKDDELHARFPRLCARFG